MNKNMIGEEKTKRIEKYLLDFESGKTTQNIRFVNLDKFSEEEIDYTIYFGLGAPMTVKYKGVSCRDIYNILLEQ